MDGTAGRDYTDRLRAMSDARWKRWLHVQAPYQRNLRRHDLGRTLDIGCGIGRNLATLPQGSVGVDHNDESVAVAKAAGFNALTGEEWAASDLPGSESFDSFLVAHVVEHMEFANAVDLLNYYVPALRNSGKVLFICPQERGYRSDPTHLSWTTNEDLARLAREVGLRPDSWKSFPLPRFAGRIFTYNEFQLLAFKS